MKLLIKATPYFAALATAIFFVLTLNQPKIVYYYITIVLLLNFLAVYAICGQGFFSKLFWNQLPTSTIFLISSFGFFLFIEKLSVQIIYLIFISLIYFLILNNLYNFLHQTREYQSFALENIFSYIHLLTFFLITSVAFGTLVFLAWPIWILVIFAFLLGVILFALTLKAMKFDLLKGKTILVLMGVLSAEVFFVISRLPTSIIVNGLLASLFYYLGSSLIKDYLHHSLSVKNVRLYLLVAFLIAFFTLATARWY